VDYERFERAVALRDGGKAEDALREFEALAKQETDEVDRSILFGAQANCLWRLGRLSEARQRWTESVTLRPDPTMELLDAYLCISEGKDEEALHKLTLFVRNHAEYKTICPQIYADAQDELGRWLYGLNRYADAIDPLEGALPFFEGHKHKELSCLLGICYYKTGKLKDAEHRLTHSMPDDPADPWWFPAQYQLGCTYFAQREYLKAHKSFEMCELYVDERDVEMKDNVSGWLAETRSKLGEGGNPRKQ
jgi:tetratricopeptide (TPR) repeat protein